MLQGGGLPRSVRKGFAFPACQIEKGCAFEA
jgi:hypothetical protein